MVHWVLWQGEQTKKQNKNEKIKSTVLSTCDTTSHEHKSILSTSNDIHN